MSTVEDFRIKNQRRKAGREAAGVAEFLKARFLRKDCLNGAFGNRTDSFWNDAVKGTTGRVEYKFNGLNADCTFTGIQCQLHHFEHESEALHCYLDLKSKGAQGRKLLSGTVTLYKSLGWEKCLNG